MDDITREGRPLEYRASIVVWISMKIDSYPVADESGGLPPNLHIHRHPHVNPLRVQYQIRAGHDSMPTLSPKTLLQELQPLALVVCQDESGEERDGKQLSSRRGRKEEKALGRGSSSAAAGSPG